MFSLCGQIELYKEDFFNTTTVLKNKPFLTVSRAFNHNFIYQEKYVWIKHLQPSLSLGKAFVAVFP